MSLLPAPRTLARCAAALVWAVRRCVAGRPRRADAAREQAIAEADASDRHYVAAIVGRFGALLGRLRSGSLRPERPRGADREATPERRQANGRGARRCFGWLLETAAQDWWDEQRVPLFRDDAELAALIALAPNAARRAMAPLCHMLGEALPDELQGARATRQARRPKVTEAMIAAAVVAEAVVAEAVTPMPPAGETAAAADAGRADERRGAAERAPPALHGAARPAAARDGARPRPAGHRLVWPGHIPRHDFSRPPSREPSHDHYVTMSQHNGAAGRIDSSGRAAHGPRPTRCREGATA